MDTILLYENYIKPNPKWFLKILSFNYPLSKEQILRHYPMLNWEFYGLVENPNIHWDIDMFERFQHLITNGLKTCWTKKNQNTYYSHLSFKKTNSLTTTFLKNEKYLQKQIDKIVKSGELLFSNIDEDFLDKYKHVLRKDDWVKISKNYSKPIKSDLLQKYWKELDSVDLMIFNENVCWEDPQTYQYFLHSRPWMLSCSSILWDKLFKPLLNDTILEELITKIKSEKKKFKLLWNEEKKGKYFIKIFIETETVYQLIDEGYCFLTKPVELKKTFELTDKAEIISLNEKSVIDGKNIRTITLKKT